MKQIANGENVKRMLMRLAHEIVERNDASDVVVIGIRRRGVQVAESIADNLEKILEKRPDTGIIDVTLYRDDILDIKNAEVLGTVINFDLNGRNVILCDDVLFTGRTVRSAISALLDIGRPNKIQLLVVADRGHRELPIRADYIGKNIPTSLSEKVSVRFTETDGEDAIYILKEGEDY